MNATQFRRQKSKWLNLLLLIPVLFM
jgi:hypothetical protein